MNKQLLGLINVFILILGLEPICFSTLVPRSLPGERILASFSDDLIGRGGKKDSGIEAIYPRKEKNGFPKNELIGAEALRSSPFLSQGPEAVPTLRLDKSRFRLGEAVFFWVGVTKSATSSISKEDRETTRLLVTRPDGTIRSQTISWPIDGVQNASWLTRTGLQHDETLPGRYTLIFEFAGQQTAPAELLLVEDPIISQVKTEFVFSRLRKPSGNYQSRVILRVRNQSNQVLRFPRPGMMNTLVSVSLRKADGSFQSDFFYPIAESSARNGERTISFDVFTWEIASTVPTVTLSPGKIYQQIFPLRTALASLDRRSSATAGRYRITFSTTLPFLIGKRAAKDGPMHIGVTATDEIVLDAKRK